MSRVTTLFARSASFIALVLLASCTNHKSDTTGCPAGDEGAVIGTFGHGDGQIERSPVFDATTHPVVVLVRYTQPQTGGLPNPGTQVAVLRNGHDPVLIDGDLATGNERIESVRRTPRRILLAKGKYYLLTGKSDGPVEIRQCN